MVEIQRKMFGRNFSGSGEMQGNMATKGGKLCGGGVRGALSRDLRGKGGGKI